MQIQGSLQGLELGANDLESPSADLPDHLQGLVTVMSGLLGQADFPCIYGADSYWYANMITLVSMSIASGE